MHAHCMVFDGYSDWEVAYILPELNKRMGVTTVGFDASTITTAGGLRVTPDLTVQDFNPDRAAILVLPGGDKWHSENSEFLKNQLAQMINQKKPVAAICGAVTFLARMGVLNELKHTGNGPKYIQRHAPNYKGHALFQKEFAVVDQNIITANGTAPVEFGYEILKILKLYKPEINEQWYQFYEGGTWIS